MSYDRQLDQACSHQVVEESLYLRDRQIVRPLRPIASLTSVRVRLNRLVEIPSEGVYTSATTTGSKTGPFDIKYGVNDILVLSVSEGSVQTLRLPYGTKLSADKIVQVLNSQVRDAYFEVSSKQRLVVKTARSGPAATLRVYPSSTALTVTGLLANRVWRGQVIVSGWSLVNDPNSLLDRPSKLIVFDYPLKGMDDFVEVDYVTVRQECRRCGGLGVENDWRYSNGQLLTIENEDLLEQEFSKMIYTIQGSNPFHVWYGTSIVNSIGRKVGASGIIQNMIVSDIHEAFRRWQTIKRQQEEKVGQPVSDEEFPFRLISVTPTQSVQDPTIFKIDIVLQNRSSRPVTIERRVRATTLEGLFGSV
jgi:hypothetical protein